MTLESQMVIIFGATGDLTRRKLIPSLYHLVKKNRLTLCTPIICVGRKQMSREAFLELLSAAQYIPDRDPETLDDLLRRIEYVGFEGRRSSPDLFAGVIREIERKHGCTSNKLMYLALPTGAFEQTARLIGALDNGEGWRRVVFEKPFGADLQSARELNSSIRSVLDEQEIYRVDHYLGKELVQNILTLRFDNEIFSSAWGGHTVDHIQITVSESLGVEKRAGYYDKSGAVRDMIQNHLLQLLSFVAMEPPEDDSSDSLRDEAFRVLKRLKPPTREDIVLGQYGPGSIKGNSVCGYRQEDGVADDSTTETYAALRAFIDTPRWEGVPVYLRTGKRLKARYAEINIVFKQSRGHLASRGSKPNMITVRIQPDEGVALAFNVRRPGEKGSTDSVLMDFCHHCHFGPNTPEAYESILYRVMQGDHSIFPRWDWIEASWFYIDQLYKNAGPVVEYVSGSTGPADADALLETNGRSWLDGEPTQTRTAFPTIR